MSLKSTAQFVLDLLERGTYSVEGTEVSIRSAQRAAVQGSRLVTPEDVRGLLSRRSSGPGGRPRVEVVDGTTQQVARELAREGPVALLNFASARNPGGGFLNGAKAQEEDLCRCSGLYPTLLEHPTYYAVNRGQRSLLYTDHAIVSPSVPFFRTRGRDPLEAPFLATVITMPAPNSGPFLRKEPAGGPRLEAAFLRRWRAVLAIAAEERTPTLLLGAWGCGAFGGDPEMAASTAAMALGEGAGSIQRVVFAIPGRGRRSRHNLEVFRRVLASAEVHS